MKKRKHRVSNVLLVVILLIHLIQTLFFKERDA